MLFAFCLLNADSAEAQQTSSKQPNFILIVADDMGFSDPRCFGGEILTPNIDKLAAQGVRYTNFYVAPTCSPTRSMLLSGIDNHLVGMGTMYEYMAPNHEDEPGYEGILTTKVPTIAEVLKANGYHTYMAGKWHLGKDKEHLPAARGFERSFSMLSGAGSYFSMSGPSEHLTPNDYNEDGNKLNKLPKGYYATTAFTDKIINYIESNKGDGKPFFAYLAHQAPHDPLMVPNKYLRKYQGKFDNGWDELRDGRLARMKEMGIVSQDAELGERLWYVPGFEKLRLLPQVISARKMEVYAAVLDYMDMEIGRLTKYLEDNDLLDNTYIVFFSDNGPDISNKADSYKNKSATNEASWMATTYKHGFENWGRAESFTAYGPSWAQVSAAPFYGFKYTTYEGGIRSPLIVVTPQHTNGGQINTSALMHVKDIAPTFLEMAGIAQPTTHNGEKVIPMQGKSWMQVVNGNSISPRTDNEYVAVELWNGKSLRKGDWKIVNVPEPVGTNEWQLYNLKSDPGERKDLAKSNPDKLKEMLADWNDYVKANNIVPANRTIYDGMTEALPPRPPVYSPNFSRDAERQEGNTTKQTNKN